METKEKLTEADLAQFSGTEQYHRLGIIKNFLATDGIAYLAQKGNCFWLFSDAMIFIRGHAPLNHEVKKNGGLVVRVDKLKKVVQYLNMDDRFLMEQKYAAMDFPFDEYEFYAMPADDENDLFLLKSEN